MTPEGMHFSVGLCFFDLVYTGKVAWPQIPNRGITAQFTQSFFRRCFSKSCKRDGSKDHLVGGLEQFLFFHILGRIIPTDELIFFRGVGQPPTSDLWLCGSTPSPSVR